MGSSEKLGQVGRGSSEGAGAQRGAMRWGAQRSWGKMLRGCGSSEGGNEVGSSEKLGQVGRGSSEGAGAQRGARELRWGHEGGGAQRGASGFGRGGGVECFPHYPMQLFPHRSEIRVFFLLCQRKRWLCGSVCDLWCTLLNHGHCSRGNSAWNGSGCV